MNSLLFDSFALLRFFQKEPGGEKVRDLLQEAADRQIPRLVNAVNVGEIIYLTQRRFGEAKKLEIFVHLHRLGLTILPCPNELIFRAAELKARYPISYADAFALASAIEHESELVTRGERDVPFYFSIRAVRSPAEPANLPVFSAPRYHPSNFQPPLSSPPSEPHIQFTRSA